MTVHVRSMMLAVLVVVTTSARLSAAPARVPIGLWDATVVVNGLEIPFQFEISGSPSALQGAFLAGELRVPSTAGSYENGVLVLRFDQYGARVDVAVTSDRLEGKYDRGTRGPAYPFKAIRAVPPRRPIGPVPRSAANGAFSSTSRRRGGTVMAARRPADGRSSVSAAIMRVDGDTGTLSGSYQDGTFFLESFSGERARPWWSSPARERLAASGRGRRPPLVAFARPMPRAKASAEPTDPTQPHGVVKSVREVPVPLPRCGRQDGVRYRPALPGQGRHRQRHRHLVPELPRRGAVSVASCTRRIARRGLEIVALSFEEPAQLKDLSRVRGFIKQYDITYPFLIAGQPEEAPKRFRRP